MRWGCPRLKGTMSQCILCKILEESDRKSSIVKITMKQEFSPHFLKIKVQKKLPPSRIGGEISLDTNYSLGRNHRLNIGHFQVSFFSRVNKCCVLYFIFSFPDKRIYIDYFIESATYGFLFTSCKTLENERVSAANE